MGFVLNYAYYLCTKLNSPLTSTIIGVFKNIFTTYIGMIFSDYTFSMLSFGGVTVSVVGSLIYNWAEFVKVKEMETTRVKDFPTAVVNVKDAEKESSSAQ
jgi:hypothetical protein